MRLPRDQRHRAGFVEVGVNGELFGIGEFGNLPQQPGCAPLGAGRTERQGDARLGALEADSVHVAHLDAGHAHRRLVVQAGHGAEDGVDALPLDLEQVEVLDLPDEKTQDDQAEGGEDADFDD